MGMEKAKWLVVQTHLKNICVKMGSSSPSFGVKIPKIFELPPPRYVVIVIFEEQGRWFTYPR